MQLRNKFSIIIILIAAFAICSLMPTVVTSQAYASSEAPFGELKNEFVELENVTTVITDTSGKEYEYRGALMPTQLEEYSCVERMSSYRIMRGADQLAEISLIDIKQHTTKAATKAAKKEILSLFASPVKQNGYYSILFTVSATDNTEMFLTGLTYDQIEAVEAEIVSSLVSGEDLDIENITFIDTEKHMTGDTDLCWAAAASNIMQYTAWAEHLGLGDCDDMMDLFNQNYYNAGYHTIAGIGYLINGVDGWSNYYYGTAPTNAGPLPTAVGNINDTQHAYDMVTERAVFSDMEDHTQLMAEQYEKLRNGWGIELVINWLKGDKTGYSGAHAISLWGYLVDKDYEESDKNRYLAFVVSNSDNTPTGENDRRSAPNILAIMWAKPYDGLANSWIITKGNGVVATMETLMPYSDELAVETDVRATRNKANNCDLVVSEINYSEQDCFASKNHTTFTDKQEIFVSPVVSNLSAKNLDSSLKYKVTVKNSNGETVKEATKSIDNFSIIAHSYQKINEYLNIGTLSKGTYTVTVDVNSDRSVEEAFYYNNCTCSSTITLIDDPAENVSMTASAASFGEKYANVGLTYEDSDNYMNKPGNTYGIEISYLIDDNWSNWDNAYYVDENGSYQELTKLSSVPNTVSIEKRGTKARLRLVVNDDKLIVRVKGNEIPLEYRDLLIITRGVNTGYYYPLEQGSHKLAKGEKLGFILRNSSTATTELICRAEICLKINGHYEVIKEETGIVLSNGEESQEISVTEWDSEYALYNSTQAYARVYYDNAGEPVCQEVELGSLYVEETHGTTVTTEADTVNKYDGVISLREAIEYANELGTSDIYIKDGVSGINLESTLYITSEISIHGNKCSTIGTNFTESGYCIYVGEKGMLTLEYIRLVNNTAPDKNVCIINNREGRVNLKNCLIKGFNAYSSKTPLIYTNGGTMNIQNTSISAIGAGNKLIVAENDGEINLLNCLINEIVGTDAIVLNNGGTINIAYTTLIDNSVYSAAGAEEGAACIRSRQGATTNVIGCIVLHKESAMSNEMDLAGNVKAFGTVYGTAEDSVIKDFTCRQSLLSDVVELDATTGLPQYRINESSTCFWQKLAIPLRELEDSIYLKVYKQELYYSVDGIDWNRTGINANFAIKDYELDILGMTHNGYYGCYSPTGKMPSPEPSPIPEVIPPKNVGTGDSDSALTYVLLMIAAIVAAGVLSAKHSKRLKK